MGRFELFEHTADIGVKAYGSDLNEVFAYAAKGMFHVITDVFSVGTVENEEITVEGADLEDLFTRWLSELLFLVDTKKMIFSEFEITIDAAKCTLRAIARGEVFDPDKHEYKTEVKAVTHHMLEINKLDDGNPGEEWMVQVLLDI
jgi:SHS2 domain-containing protein